MGAYGGPLTMILSNQLIGISNYGNQLPKGFALYQNYPNPFNPSTSISFDISIGDIVTLTVYDITGKEIEAIVKGYKPPGRYEITFNALGLATGIYFYKLSSGNFIMTRKMVIAK
jgi:hypothetical protein